MIIPGRLKIVRAERAVLKPKFWNEWMNEKNILGFILCAEAEKIFQTPWIILALLYPMMPYSEWANFTRPDWVRHIPEAHLLTWFNFNPSMDKLSYAQ